MHVRTDGQPVDGLTALLVGNGLLRAPAAPRPGAQLRSLVDACGGRDDRGGRSTDQADRP